MPYCRKCGKQHEEDAAFCSYCGTRIEALQPPSQEPIVQEAKPREAQRLRAIEIVGILFIVIVSVAIIIHETMPSFLSPQPTQTLTSTDWSGYSVSTSLKNPQPVVTSVSGSWTVPSVTPTQGFSYSATWVGVGGQFDQTLIQVGTQQDSINGGLSYSAWYELLPNPPITITTLPIKSGDVIKATITQTDSIRNTWSINISDVTTGQSYQTSVVYGSQMLSAEWVVERPTIGNRVGNLADFGSVKFTGCSATVGGKTGKIVDFSSSQFTMINRQNVALVLLSSIGQDGSSFTASYISLS
jgi:Peptidase A4 family/zinc-ribbon domain